MSGEYERIYRLAKAFAVSEGVLVCIYRKSDGTYGFAPETSETENKIVEYITPY